MKKMIVANFVITILLIVVLIFGEIMWDMYMAAPIGSESEALYLSLRDMSTAVNGIGVITMFILNSVLFFKRNQITE